MHLEGVFGQTSRGIAYRLLDRFRSVLEILVSLDAVLSGFDQRG